MAENDFVMAVGPDDQKRYVPRHYLDNPAFGFRLPPSARAQEPAETSDVDIVREPASTEVTGERVEEPAAATSKTSKRSGAAGENKEAS